MQRHLLWTITTTTLACADPVAAPEPFVDPPRVPADWRADPIDPPKPDPDGGLRLTIETAAGPFTFPALDADGNPLELEHAVGFSPDPDGPAVLYASDGTSRWLLDPETLTFVDPEPWIDATGVPHRPDTLTGGWYANTPVLVTSHRDTLRLWDEATAILSDPVPLTILDRDAPDATSEGFAPSALTLLHRNPTAGTLLALDLDGSVHLELQPLAMTPYIVPPTLCGQGRTFAASLVVTATEATQQGPFEQEVYVVAGSNLFRQGDLFCFDPPTTLVDHHDTPIEPVFGTSVDLDDDGLDELVWGHR